MSISVLVTHDTKRRLWNELVGPWGSAHIFRLGDPSLPGAIRQTGDDTLIVDVDLKSRATVEAVRPFVSEMQAYGGRVVFVVSGDSHHDVVQARALRCSATLERPVSWKAVAELVLGIDMPGGAPAWSGVPTKTLRGLEAGHLLFSHLLSEPRGEIRPDLVNGATACILDAVVDGGIGPFVESVRQHHSATFQHCIMVTGAAVAFGNLLGFKRADTQRLGIAAAVHDVGKATIPLSILDKPALLDQQEWEIMRKHPAAGFDILEKAGGFEDEVLDAVLHHHEALDGTGYPHGLKAGAVGDMTRLITISDVFAALVEKRSYKAGMSGADAYARMSGMTGMLDLDLLRRFEPIARSCGVAPTSTVKAPVRRETAA